MTSQHTHTHTQIHTHIYTHIHINLAENEENKLRLLIIFIARAHVCLHIFDVSRHHSRKMYVPWNDILFHTYMCMPGALNREDVQRCLLYTHAFHIKLYLLVLRTTTLPCMSVHGVIYMHSLSACAQHEVQTAFSIYIDMTEEAALDSNPLGHVLYAC